MALPQHSEGRGIRGGHLGRRIQQPQRRRQRLDLHELRRGSGTGLPALRHARERFLGRRPARRQPVRRDAGGRGHEHRRAPLAFSDHAPRPVGLRPASSSRSPRYYGRPEAGGAGHQAGPAVRVRPGDRRTRLADQRHAGSAFGRARREGRSNAAHSDPARSLRPPGRIRGRSERPHA